MNEKNLPIISIFLASLALATGLVVTGNIIVNVYINDSPDSVEQKQEQNTTIEEGSESSPKEAGRVDVF